MRGWDALSPTIVYDTYWRFAAERQAIYLRRLERRPGPLTDDHILRQFRFTNTYRAADRVSQYLIGEVQYREDRSQSPDEVFFRTMLFKLFNRIETWRLLEDQLGPMSWQSADLHRIEHVLDETKKAGQRIYSAAYIMPSPAFGRAFKHANHLALLWRMMADGLPGRISRTHSLRVVYELLLGYPGLGPFLAFQYAIDLNYSTLTDFAESQFVVAGPGALDGIAKCFGTDRTIDPQRLIHEVTERQDDEFANLGLTFPGLFGRKLHPIDCQNIFCEISKYARIAHPEFEGVSGRTRIKQRYSSIDGSSVHPIFPPKWGLSPSYNTADPEQSFGQPQGRLF